MSTKFGGIVNDVTRKAFVIVVEIPNWFQNQKSVLCSLGSEFVLRQSAEFYSILIWNLCRDYHNLVWKIHSMFTLCNRNYFIGIICSLAWIYVMQGCILRPRWRKWVMHFLCHFPSFFSAKKQHQSIFCRWLLPCRLFHNNKKILCFQTSYHSPKMHLFSSQHAFLVSTCSCLHKRSH